MLAVPSLEDFIEFKGEAFDDVENPTRAIMFLKMATVLVETRLGIVSVVPDSNAAEMVRWAIMDLAWFVGTSMEERDAMFSPFSSERIGSYSYSKAARAMAGRAELGVPFYDLLLEMLAAVDLKLAAAVPWSSSSALFERDPQKQLDSMYPSPLFGGVVQYQDPVLVYRDLGS